MAANKMIIFNNTVLNYYTSILFYVGVPLLLFLILLVLISLTRRQGSIKQEFKELNRTLAKLAAQKSMGNDDKDINDIDSSLLNDGNRTELQIQNDNIDLHKEIDPITVIGVIASALIIVAIVIAIILSE